MIQRMALSEGSSGCLGSEPDLTAKTLGVGHRAEHAARDLGFLIDKWLSMRLGW
jgi:hypothetical protein